MSDAAFPTAKYPGYTTAELNLMLMKHAERRVIYPANQLRDIRAEIARRALVLAGVTSVMTAGERLRHIKAGG